MTKQRRALYLPGAVRPHQVVEDEGLGVDVSETLRHVGADPGARPARHTHHCHEPGQPVAALRLPPHQLLHHVAMTRPVDAEPAEAGESTAASNIWASEHKTSLNQIKTTT